MAPSGQTKQQDEQRSKMVATPTQRSSSSTPFSWILLVAMVAAVTVFANGPAPCSASSVDEQSSGDSAPSSSSSSSSSNLSKEEPQLSAASGLVKRSAPVHASSYGHSIMRFGRAPHNIMHFGKRSQGQGQDQDSAYYQDPESVLDQSSQEVVNSVPDWILANYLAAAKQQQQVAPSNPKVVTKYLLVPVQVPAGAAKSGNFGPMPIQKKASRGGFSEDSDNVFMHFG